MSLEAAQATAAALTFTAPQAGPTLTLSLGIAAAPVGVTMTILVEDPRGGAAAIDLRVLRSGPPSLSGITPGSAFVTQPQDVRITGNGFDLAGAANTTFAFDGLAPGNPTVVSDSLARCTTPTTAALGPTVIGVANQFGMAALPASAFTFHAWPIDLFANDARIDAGAASSVEIARDGAAVHAVWLEGTALVHRGSSDAGQTWSTPTPLSAVEAVTEPQLLVDGDVVLAAWIGDGTAVWVRRSDDGGASWDPAVRVDAAAVVTPASRVRIAQSGTRRYATWVSGNVIAGNAAVLAVASATSGATWTAPNPVSVTSGNQRTVALACSGDIAWVLYEQDLPGQPRGAYVARTLDTGSTWGPERRLNPSTTAASDVSLCTDGLRVYATWLQNGGLALAASTDRGTSWGNTIIDLQTSQQGVVSAPHVSCDDVRLAAVFVVGNTSVRAATFTHVGATVQRTTIESTTTVSGEPRIANVGNYAFVVWREGEVVGGTARLRFAASTNAGLQFTAAAAFGDGGAVQTAPRLAVDGAHVRLAWIDNRAATAGVFVNGTEF